MLNDKVLVNVYVLNIDKNFDMYVPINEKIGNILLLLKKSFTEIDMVNFNKDLILLNLLNGKVYQYDEILKNTDINNNAKLLLI